MVVSLMGMATWRTLRCVCASLRYRLPRATRHAFHSDCPSSTLYSEQFSFFSLPSSWYFLPLHTRHLHFCHTLRTFTHRAAPLIPPPHIHGYTHNSHLCFSIQLLHRAVHTTTPALHTPSDTATFPAVVTHYLRPAAADPAATAASPRWRGPLPRYATTCLRLSYPTIFYRSCSAARGPLHTTHHAARRTTAAYQDGVYAFSPLRLQASLFRLPLYYGVVVTPLRATRHYTH